MYLNSRQAYMCKGIVSTLLSGHRVTEQQRQDSGMESKCDMRKERGQSEKARGKSHEAEHSRAVREKMELTHYERNCRLEQHCVEGKDWALLVS